MLKSRSVKIVLGVAVFLTGVYLALPIVSPFFISYYLAQHNIDLIELDIAYPTPRAPLNIKTVAIDVLDVGQFSLSDVVIRKSDHIVVAVKNVAVSTVTTKPASSKIRNNENTGTTISDILPSVILPRIPGITVSVDRYVYNEGRLSGTDLVLEADRDRIELSSLGQFASGESFRVHVAVNKDDTFDVNFLSHREALKATISGRVSSTEKHAANANNINLTVDTILAVTAEFNETLHGNIGVVSNIDLPLQKSIGEAVNEVSFASTVNIDELKTPYGVLEGVFDFSFYTADDGYRLTLFDSEENNGRRQIGQLQMTPSSGASSETMTVKFDPTEFAFTHAIDIPNNPVLLAPLSLAIFFDDVLAGKLSVTKIAPDSAGNTLKLNTHVKLQTAFFKRYDHQLSFSETSFALDLDAELSSETAVLAFKRAEPLSLVHSTLVESGVTRLLFSLPEQNITLHYEDLSVSDTSIELKMGHANIKDGVALGVRARKVGERVVVDLASQPFRYGEHKIPQYYAAINTVITDVDRFMSDISVSNACNAIIVSARWQHSATSSIISAKSYKRFTPEESLKRWLNADILPFDITAGELTYDVSLDFAGPQDNNELNIAFTDTDVIGDIGRFEGVQFKFRSSVLDFTSQEMPIMRFPFSGKVRQANIGVISDDVILEGMLSREASWSVALEKFEFPVFNGVVSANGQTIPLTEDWVVELSLRNIDLEELVDTQQIDGLRSTGMISGAIPIVKKSGSFSIGDGNVGSERAGVINYISPLGDANLNDHVKLTLDVLENFNYSTLDSSVSYENGSLHLASKISGNNPDVAEGQRVELNLNTEIALQSAFEVMRVKSGLESQIEKYATQQSSPSDTINLCRSGNLL